MERNATAVWNGNINDGSGLLTTESTTLKNTPYSWKSKFTEGTGAKKNCPVSKAFDVEISL